MKCEKIGLILMPFFLLVSCNVEKEIDLNKYLNLEYLIELDNEEQGKYNCSVKSTWFREPESKYFDKIILYSNDGFVMDSKTSLKANYEYKYVLNGVEQTENKVIESINYISGGAEIDFRFPNIGDFKSLIIEYEFSLLVDYPTLRKNFNLNCSYFHSRFNSDKPLDLVKNKKNEFVTNLYVDSKTITNSYEYIPN